MDLVVGVDAGGTASRAVVATVSGTVVGRGRAGPGNPLTYGPAAATAIGQAITQALTGLDPARVAAGLLGVAGTSAMTDPALAHAFTATWATLGLTCPMPVVGDAVTAFAAGTPSPSGTVLIAGTGAVAARIAGHEVAEVADGLGWLLGDEGSGRWIGLRAMRCAVRDWSSPLARRVAAHAGAGCADDLVRWAHRLPLAEIDALAPVVCAAARDGEPNAAAVITEAADHLLGTLAQVDSGGPVVLAGGLLASSTPVREAVLRGLVPRGTTVGTSHDPAGAAAWLAMRSMNTSTAPALHSVMLGGPPTPGAATGA